jgi:mono/diheme cytochrome c family protein
MSAKPITFVLVAATALIAGGGLVRAAEKQGAQKPHVVTASRSAKKAATLPTPAFDAAKAFNDLGCSGCHGDDGIYRDEIKGALGKPVDQVARWIRNAPSIKPDTDMPNFENVIDTQNSVALAGWVMDRAAHLD